MSNTCLRIRTCGPYAREVIATSRPRSRFDYDGVVPTRPLRMVQPRAWFVEIAAGSHTFCCRCAFCEIVRNSRLKRACSRRPARWRSSPRFAAGLSGPTQTCADRRPGAVASAVVRGELGEILTMLRSDCRHVARRELPRALSARSDPMRTSCSRRRRRVKGFITRGIPPGASRPVDRVEAGSDLRQIARLTGDSR